MKAAARLSGSHINVKQSNRIPGNKAVQDLEVRKSSHDRLVTSQLLPMGFEHFSCFACSFFLHCHLRTLHFLLHYKRS